MDRIYLMKKRMIYPERLELDRLLKTPMLYPVGSWCNKSLEREDPHETEHETREIPVPQAALREACSIDNLEQGTSDRQSAISTICQSNSELSSIFHGDGQPFVHQRIRDLVRAFTERAQRIRHRLELPPTPSTASSDLGDGRILQPPPLFQSTQLSQSESRDSSICMPPTIKCHNLWTCLKNVHCGSVLDSQGIWYLFWLFVVMLCYMYNCWVIPLRSTFPYQTPENTPIWFALDYTADAIYLLDLVVIKPRLMYLDDGFWVRDSSLTRKKYMEKLQFKMDVLSLLPLDLFYLKYGSHHLMFRLPRLLKIQTFWEFYHQVDSRLSSPYVVRMARTLTYMLYLIHLNACAYYALSTWEGLDSNRWVFNGKGNAYVRCIYFATKIATSIGKNPKPENEQEYLFMTFSWLTGVFVFALLIGQMRDIAATATRIQTEYRKLVDETLQFMRRQNLPQKLQERVKLWFTFTWEQQHTLDERRILDTLPDKLKTDVAINVHFHTLSKVQLFHDCDEALLRDLVLKLRSVIFLPGDFICRKGEVGKEMYIVKLGKVEVMGGNDNSEVLATLTEGSVFGEISLLALAGGNRRTATVRSKGFSNLFVLSKSDLNEAIVHYPEAQEILKRKARLLMHENAVREKRNREKQMESQVIIGNKANIPDTPRLVHTVIQVMGQLEIASGHGRNKSLRSTESQKSHHTHCSSSKKCGGRSRNETTFQCNVTVHREMSQ
ncbi:cyclic nucleotide-gated channel beta-1 [Anabrus simplex]|uniref:cyclic nucleotide-gated channel beta-1 n=1 Tax=Anabrus simplex TaxID=316456 RepID=UPI0035A27649